MGNGWMYYWLDGEGKVQITEDPEVAEKALHEYKQIWWGNKVELEMLGAVGDSEILNRLNNIRKGENGRSRRA